MIALLLALDTGSVAAAPDDFVGSWSVIAYGDNNFANGVVLQPYNLTLNVTLSSDPTRDLELNILDTNTGGTMNTSLDIDPAWLASLPNRDVSWPGTWSGFPPNLLDVVVMSNGNSMAMGVVGREPTNQAETGFFYTHWERTPVTTVSRDNFLGTWVTNQRIGDTNLHNSSTGFDLELFPDFTITASSDPDAILIDLLHPEVDPIELQVEGNRAFLTAPFHDSGLGLAFDILHDGENLSFIIVGQEYYDLTDISLGLAVASPVPLPAPIWFLVSGLGLLGALGRRRVCGENRGHPLNYRQRTFI